MPALHPRLQELLAAQFANDAAESIEKRTATAVRSNALKIRELQRPPAALHAVWDVALSSASDVGARFYRPHEGRSPLIVYFHGGGFVIDGAGHDAPLRDLAAATRCTIVAPEVRLAPEHRFPAALHDARQFARWICDRPPPYHRATSREARARPGSRGHESRARRKRLKPSDRVCLPLVAMLFPQRSLESRGGPKDCG